MNSVTVISTSSLKAADAGTKERTSSLEVENDDEAMVVLEAVVVSLEVMLEPLNSLLTTPLFMLLSMLLSKISCTNEAVALAFVPFEML